MAYDYSQTFNADWLPKDKRTEYDRYRNLFGPNSMIGRSRGVTEQQWNQGAWDKYGQHAPLNPTEGNFGISSNPNSPPPPPPTGRGTTNRLSLDSPKAYELAGGDLPGAGYRGNYTPTWVNEAVNALTAPPAAPAAPTEEELRDAAANNYQTWAGRYDTVLAGYDTTGKAAQDTINQGYDWALGRSQAAARDAGFGTSSLMPGLSQQNERFRAHDLGDLAFNLNLAKTNAGERLSGDYNQAADRALALQLGSVDKFTDWINTNASADLSNVSNAWNNYLAGASGGSDALNVASDSMRSQGPPPINPGDVLTSVLGALASGRAAGYSWNDMNSAYMGAKSYSPWGMAQGLFGPLGNIGGSGTGNILGKLLAPQTNPGGGSSAAPGGGSSAAEWPSGLNFPNFSGW